MIPMSVDHAPPLHLRSGGKERVFDLDNPELPGWIAKRELTSGGYPFDEELPKGLYKEHLRALQVELVKLQYWQEETGVRIVCLFEGRDAAGKGGTIGTIREDINPRQARIVALPKPSDRERTQWYFQRYVAHLPAAGELALFDRSWYNRAGVEPVMGFCTPDEHAAFLREAPAFEQALVREGILLFKFWLAIGRETQLARFHARRHDPLKIWKLSPMDVAALERWDDYSQNRDLMIRATHTVPAPWTVVRMNDKRRGRLAVIETLLSAIDYAGKTDIPAPDPRIVMSGPDFLSENEGA